MTTTPETRDEILEEVRSHYGEVARSGGACCAPGCCSPRTGTAPSADDAALRLGYTEADLASTPDGANLGLGCGNPRAIADLRAGETVLDLGSGAGFDCFLAARQVGQTGRVIGVDMTADMVSRARASAGKAGASNVEFRLGEIEHLPIPDRAVDVVISNCVINLSPDKRAVLREAFRVLRPGGRLAISDVVALAPVPDQVRRDLSAYTGCIAGAATIAELEGWLAEAGFDDLCVELDSASTAAMAEAVGTDLDFSRLAASARIRARRPAGERRS